MSLEITQKDFDDFNNACKIWFKNCSETRSAKVWSQNTWRTSHNIVLDDIEKCGREKVSESDEKTGSSENRVGLGLLDWETSIIIRKTSSLCGFLWMKDKLAVLDRAKNLKGSGKLSGKEGKNYSLPWKHLVHIAYLKYDQLIHSAAQGSTQSNSLSVFTSRILIWFSTLFWLLFHSSLHIWLWKTNSWAFGFFY